MSRKPLIRLSVPPVLLLLGLILALPARAADEGIDYALLNPALPTESGDKVEVVEVFWYGCPHCWHLEPDMKSWQARQPEGVALRRMPGIGPHWTPHARAFYAAESLGKLDQLHEPLFKAMQVQRRPIRTREDLIRFAGEVGFDEQEFAAAYDSFYVETKIRKATQMSRRYGIDGVPALIINGKYRTSPSQTGGRAQMFRVLDSLVQKELAAQGSPDPAPVAGGRGEQAPASGS